MLQPDTVQSAVGYESTTQEINVVRDLIDNHQQLFGVRLSVIHFKRINSYFVLCLSFEICS